MAQGMIETARREPVTQWIRVLAAKPRDMSFIFRTHRVRRDNCPLKVVL